MFIKGNLVSKVDFEGRIADLAEEVIGTADKVSLRRGWDSSIKSQGNQLAIHTPSRQPSSVLGQSKNQIPSWGRMPTARTATSWSSPSIKGYNKTSDIRNAHFDAPRLVGKSTPYIQDTFSQVFGANSQHILGHNRRL